MLKKLIILTTMATGILSCSGSSSGFKSIKSAEPAELSLQQKNALLSLSSNFGLSLSETAGGGFADEIDETAAIRRDSSSSKALASSDGSFQISFSENRACEVSGQVTNTGTYNYSVSNDNTPNRVNFQLTAASRIEASDCEDTNAFLDGYLDLNLNMQFLIRDILEPKTRVDATLSWTGSFTAQGRDAQASLQNVSMTFNDLKLKIFFDTGDSDTLSAFINLYIGSADNELRRNMLRDIMQCSGSLVIDDMTYSCESIFATLLAEES
jgi:hypothetical protein